jgi:hypothetical protein
MAFLPLPVSWIPKRIRGSRPESRLKTKIKKGLENPKIKVHNKKVNLYAWDALLYLCSVVESRKWITLVVCNKHSII